MDEKSHIKLCNSVEGSDVVLDMNISHKLEMRLG